MSCQNKVYKVLLENKYYEVELLIVACLIIYSASCADFFLFYKKENVTNAKYKELFEEHMSEEH